MSEPMYIESWEIADVLSRLVDKSLVHYDPASGRYSFLETVRQYARDRLMERGEGGPVSDRHFHFYREFADDPETKLRGSGQSKWMPRFDADADNLRRAMEWALGNPDLWLEGTEMTLDVVDLFLIRGRHREGAAWTLAAYERAPVDDLARKSLMLAAAVGLSMMTSEPLDSELAREALDMASASGDLRSIANAQFSWASMTQMRGEPEEALASFVSAQRLFEQIGNRHMQTFAGMNVGNVHLQAGRLPEAEATYRECMRIREELNDRRGVGAAVASLGYIHEARGDWKQAVECFREAVRADFECDALYDLSSTIPVCACGACLDGRYEDAAMLIGFGDGLLAPMGMRRDRVDQAACERQAARVREVLSGEAFDAAYERGKKLSLEEAVALALGDQSGDRESATA